MIEAVIFDVDGTLVDSVDLHAKAWQEAFAHHDIATDFLEVRSQIGKGADELMPVFLSEHQMTSMANDVEKFRTHLFRDKYLHAVHGFPKVRDLFVRLLDDGKQVALASSAKDEELEHYKCVANITDLDLSQASADDVHRSKPHPDIFEAAMVALDGPKRRRSVVVGDTPHDAVAASKAGLNCVGLLCGGFSSEILREAGCSVLYQDPSALLVAYLTQGDRVFDHHA